jgi:hypothetical protein
MGYVAATVGFAALGAYLGRDSSGGVGLLLFISALIADYADTDPAPLWQSAGVTAALVAALGAYGYGTRRRRTRHLRRVHDHRLQPPAAERRQERRRLRRAADRHLDSDVQGGSVGELLDVAVERSVLDQLEVEVGRTLEDRVVPGLSGDDGEERHLDAVDQAGGHQRAVQREAAVRAQRHSDSCLSRATMSTASPLTRVASGQSRGPFSVVDATAPAGARAAESVEGGKTSKV